MIADAPDGGVPPYRHPVTLGRVLLLVLVPLVTSLAFGVWNAVRISNDRSEQIRHIDAEICRVVAEIPGDLRGLEAEINCPLTAPVPAAPEIVVVPPSTVTVRPEPRSSVPPAGTTRSPAGPHAVGGTATSPVPARPSPTPSPTPTPTPSPSPFPSPLLCQILNPLTGGTCP